MTGLSLYVSRAYAMNHDVEMAHTGRSPAYKSCIHVYVHAASVHVNRCPVTRRTGIGPAGQQESK
jgi:hypothetical protein